MIHTDRCDGSHDPEIGVQPKMPMKKTTVEEMDTKVRMAYTVLRRYGSVARVR